jgi:hypothetical protein
MLMGFGWLMKKLGALGTRDQARLEDAWPAEAPSNEGRSVGSDSENAQHTFRICCVIWKGLSDVMYW